MGVKFTVFKKDHSLRDIVRYYFGYNYDLVFLNNSFMNVSFVLFPYKK